ncbi:MAG: hypothetical protein KDK71_09250, partial [Chlamydiia bacterium]|nr:hypothetical protein [Chlamydiia bacterium]
METLSSIQVLIEALKKETALLFEGLWDSPKAILSLLSRLHLKKNVLIITGGEREGRLFDDLSFFTKEHLFSFPAWETLPGEEI